MRRVNQRAAFGKTKETRDVRPDQTNVRRRRDHRLVNAGSDVSGNGAISLVGPQLQSVGQFQALVANLESLDGHFAGFAVQRGTFPLAGPTLAEIPGERRIARFIEQDD